MSSPALPLPNMIDPMPTFLYGVVIDGITQAAFTEVTLPALRVETEDIKEGGLNQFIHKLPVRVNAGTLTLKNGIGIGDQLLKWYLQVAAGNFGAARKSVTIHLYGGVRKRPVLSINLAQAYPIRWTGPNLRAGESAAAIEEIELAHSGITFSAADFTALTS